MDDSKPSVLSVKVRKVRQEHTILLCIEGNFISRSEIFGVDCLQVSDRRTGQLIFGVRFVGG